MVTSLWFDEECRGAKRNVCHEGPLALSTSPTAAAWRAERRVYFNLLCTAKATHVLDQTRRRRPVTTVSSVVVLR